MLKNRRIENLQSLQTRKVQKDASAQKSIATAEKNEEQKNNMK